MGFIRESLEEASLNSSEYQNLASFAKKSSTKGDMSHRKKIGLGLAGVGGLGLAGLGAKVLLRGKGKGLVKVASTVKGSKVANVANVTNVAKEVSVPVKSKVSIPKANQDIWASGPSSARVRKPNFDSAIPTAPSMALAPARKLKRIKNFNLQSTKKPRRKNDLWSGPAKNAPVPVLSPRTKTTAMPGILESSEVKTGRSKRKRNSEKIINRREMLKNDAKLSALLTAANKGRSGMRNSTYMDNSRSTLDHLLGRKNNQDRMKDNVKQARDELKGIVHKRDRLGTYSRGSNTANF